MATKDFANGFVEDALRKGLTSAAAKNGASIPLSVHMSRAEQEKLVLLSAGRQVGCRVPDSLRDAKARMRKLKASHPEDGASKAQEGGTATS